MTDQVEDSSKYQSLRDENDQLRTLLEQLRESDAGKLRIAFEQVTASAQLPSPAKIPNVITNF
ncbi:MAG: hypothetical protein AAF529_15355, partial [Pseudomonadota bacterium]